jgi:hypothetical protein
MGAVDSLVDEAMSMCGRTDTLEKHETMWTPTRSDIRGHPSFLGGPPIACPEAIAGPGGTWSRATGTELGRLAPGTSVDCWTGPTKPLVFDMLGARP